MSYFRRKTSTHKRMELSIIIVSYNVKYFLEQCLSSVVKAARIAGRDTIEIIVVDNNSSDGTPEYLQNRYEGIDWIINKTNEGFAKANNLALKKAKGDFILFLNPDTIIPENSLKDCLQFFRDNSDAGAMGVRMLNGQGLFLKESKRGFPSPWSAFCRLSGLSFLFPRSNMFAHYYMGSLSSGETNVVEALSGAFMMCKGEVVRKLGGFDERFFMYAEDIDLSYRIQEQGHRNYYFPGVTIIHFKGESTAKDFKYIRLFYKAMRQFAEKYYGGGANSLLLIFLSAAIWVRGALAALLQLFSANKNRANGIPVNEAKLVGDTNSREELKQSIIDKETAGVIVYCEGSGLPFSIIIEQLEKEGKLHPVYIHARETRSLVSGSPGDLSKTALLNKVN